MKLFDISHDQRETILFQKRETCLSYSYFIYKLLSISVGLLLCCLPHL